MAFVINCDCGVVVSGETEEELVANAQDHAQSAHAMTVTREQALAMAQSE